MPHEEAMMLGPAGSRLYAMLHRPAAAARGALAVCAPLFEERKSAARMLAEAARALCAAGWCVLRFDYRGCGDSDGAFRDYAVSDWLADARTAVAFAAAQAPGGPAGLIGLRLGAALAYAAAAGSGAGRVILWEPVPHGGRYVEEELRKKLMKEMMTFGRSRLSRRELLESLEQGGDVDFDGYPLTARLYRELGALDIGAAEAPAGLRAALLHVSPHAEPAPAMTALHGALRGRGVAADFRHVALQPFWNLVGYVDCGPLIGETLEWLARES